MCTQIYTIYPQDQSLDYQIMQINSQGDVMKWQAVPRRHMIDQGMGHFGFMAAV